MISAMENIGPHLLGRNPMPVDSRDYRLEDYHESVEKASSLLTWDTPISVAYTEFDLGKWYDWYAFYHAVKLLGPLPDGPTPTPTPVPPKPTAATLYAISLLSDQGQTPHCVGFEGLDWGNTDPVDDRWPNAEGDRIYYLCQPGDVGKPLNQQQGSDSRTLCKVLQSMGRIGAYAFTTSAQVAVKYIQNHGSVGLGCDWDSSMFDVDSDGYIKPNGDVQGGHEVGIRGYSAEGYGTVSKPSVLVQNHWGQWGAGNKGYCYLTVDDLQSLLERNGECFAGLELPL